MSLTEWIIVGAAGLLVVFLVVALTTLAVLGHIGREISAQHEGILGPECRTVRALSRDPDHPAAPAKVSTRAASLPKAEVGLGKLGPSGIQQSH
jgi:hypothetical protein